MTGHLELWILGLLAAVAGLVMLSNVLRVPYPVFLVLGGLALGLIPIVPERIERARRYGIEVRNPEEHDDVAEAIREMTDGLGTDSVIDAVGMEAHGSSPGRLAQKIAGAMPDSVGQRMLQEAGVDRLEAFYLAIDVVRRGGTISHRCLRRYCRPFAHADVLRQADPVAHGTGQRPALDRRYHAARHRRRRPARGRRLRTAPAATRRGAARLRDLPEKAGRREQDLAPALIPLVQCVGLAIVAQEVRSVEWGLVYAWGDT